MLMLILSQYVRIMDNYAYFWLLDGQRSYFKAIQIEINQIHKTQFFLSCLQVSVSCKVCICLLEFLVFNLKTGVYSVF